MLKMTLSPIPYPLSPSVAIVKMGRLLEPPHRVDVLPV